MAAPITPANLISYTDKQTAQWLAVQTMSGIAATKQNDLDTLVATISDYDLRSSLAQPLHTPGNLLALTSLSKQAYQVALLGLKQACIAAGITLAAPTILDLNSFALYYNTGAGGPFTCLLHPLFGTFYGTVYGTTPISPANLWSPAVPTMAKWVQGTGLTPGTAANPLYGGVVGLSAVVTGWTGAGGACTFAVSGLNSAGAVVTDNWTVAIAANGTFTPTGTVVKLVQSVTAITPTAMTAGTIVVSGTIPGGRANPPT